MFCEAAGSLGSKLGVLLFQLPPSFKKDLSVLDGFLATLPPGARAAFEFRHDSWHDAEVIERLSASGLALCVAASARLSTPVEGTATAGYVMRAIAKPRWRDGRGDDRVGDGRVRRGVRLLQARRPGQGTRVRSDAHRGTDRVSLSALAARGESLAAFDRRCIPPADVAPRSNTAGIFSRRVLSGRRITGLGATRDFHHGLLALAAAERALSRGSLRSRFNCSRTKSTMRCSAQYPSNPGVAPA